MTTSVLCLGTHPSSGVSDSLFDGCGCGGIIVVFVVVVMMTVMLVMVIAVVVAS